MVKKIDSKIKKGEYFFFIMYLLILLISLSIVHKLFSNDVTASLLFFGYTFIIFLLAEYGDQFRPVMRNFRPVNAE